MWRTQLEICLNHQSISIASELSGCVQVLLTTLMTLTGNYGFYPLLILTLCLSLIDDTWFNSWTGSGLTYKGRYRCIS